MRWRSVTASEVRLCFVKEDSEGSAEALISAPIRRAEFDTHHCVIHCPTLFDIDKAIVGVDAEQATELSIMFVTDLMVHKGYVLVEEEDDNRPS